MNIILLAPEELDSAGRVNWTDRRADHLRRVLRLAPGDEVRVGLLDGPRGRAVVEALDERGVRLRCEFEAETPPRPAVDLLLALPRPKVLARLLPQLAALGVGRLLLTNAWKVERPFFDAHQLRPENLHRALLEGLQQAGDTRLPLVSVHKLLRPLLEEEISALCPGRRRLAAEPGSERGVGEALRSGPPPGGALLAVGPEGGWIPRELELLERCGFVTVGLGFGPGRRVLRSDTACLALLALAHEVLAGGSRTADGVT